MKVGEVIRGVAINKEGDVYSFEFRGKKYTHKVTECSQEDAIQLAKDTVFVEAVKNNEEELWLEINPYLRKVKVERPKGYEAFINGYKSKI